jgi:Flp pilus assembly protein TadG
MRGQKIPFLNRLVKEERGQTAAIVTVMLVVLIALSALGIETGHVYYAYRMLQASTNAAALAAGQAMPTIGTSSETCSVSGQPVNSAYCNLYLYSSATQDSVTGMNTSNLLSSASISANFYCSPNAAASPINIDCAAATGCPSSGCNAVTATQTAKVPLWFGGFLGIKTFNLTAVASATMKGGGHPPYNIAVIIDTTASMQDSASTSDGCTSSLLGLIKPSQIQCAVYGVEQMLLEMYPCVNSGCTTSTNYADAVSLFVFPAVSMSDSSTDYSNDYCSLLGGDSSVPYNFINVTTGTSQNLAMQSTKGQTDAGTYELIPFDTAYKASNAATTLSTSDYLSKAVGYSGTSCGGLAAPGGQGTYYAQVIYAAQSALLTQQAVATKAGYSTQNVMILLSDGDSTASNSLANTSLGGLNGNGNQIVALSGTLNGTCTSTKVCTNASASVYTYPSAIGQCWQAVQAAQTATTAGTKVYTVAMGSPTSAPAGGGSCVTDQVSETTLSGSTGAESYPSGSYAGQAGSACNAIGAMASTGSMFYSDATSGCTSSQNNEYTTIGGIFKAVGNSLTYSRLIPNGS